jgi:hypothetical protein
MMRHKKDASFFPLFSCNLIPGAKIPGIAGNVKNSRSKLPGYRADPPHMFANQKRDLGTSKMEPFTRFLEPFTRFLEPFTPKMEPFTPFFEQRPRLSY